MLQIILINCNHFIKNLICPKNMRFFSFLCIVKQLIYTKNNLKSLCNNLKILPNFLIIMIKIFYLQLSQIMINYCFVKLKFYSNFQNL